MTPPLRNSAMFQVHGVESHGKRKLWLLFIMAGWQPLVMWWLTYSLVPAARPGLEEMP